MALAGWVTLTHSSGSGAGLDEVGPGDELAAVVTKNALSVAVVVDDGVWAGLVVLGWAELGWAELGWLELGFAEVELELGFAEWEPGVAEVLVDWATAGDRTAALEGAA